MDLLTSQYKELLLEKLLTKESSPHEIFRIEHLQQMMDEIYINMVALGAKLPQYLLDDHLIQSIYKRHHELKQRDDSQE